MFEDILQGVPAIQERQFAVTQSAQVKPRLKTKEKRANIFKAPNTSPALLKFLTFELWVPPFSH